MDRSLAHGVLVTDDDELARVDRSLRNQGRSEMGGWLEHERLGLNFGATVDALPRGEDDPVRRWCDTNAPDPRIDGRGRWPRASTASPR